MIPYIFFNRTRGEWEVGVDKNPIGHFPSKSWAEWFYTTLVDAKAAGFSIKPRMHKDFVYQDGTRDGV